MILKSCAGNSCILFGLRRWVSGGIGATNACTRMYRPDFIVEHGMRNYKVHRVAPRLERVAACLIKCSYLQVAEGHAMGLPFSWLLLLGKQKK